MLPTSSASETHGHQAEPSPMRAPKPNFVAKSSGSSAPPSASTSPVRRLTTRV